MIVSRKENRNVVIISETEYNELAKAKKNAEYLAKLAKADEQIQNGHVITKDHGRTSCYGGISPNEKLLCRRWMERIPLLAKPRIKKTIKRINQLLQSIERDGVLEE